MKRSDLLATTLAVVCGCASESSAPPSPSSVEPRVGYSAVATDVVIHGRAFDVGVEARVDGASRVDARFRAWLGTTELEDVAFVDTRTLRARVPAGLAPGTWDLTVEGPHGRGTLPAAYEVAIGGAPALTATLVAPERVDVGQDVVVRATSTAQGNPIRAVVATPRWSAGAPVLVASDAAPVDLAAGASSTASFTYRFAEPGVARVSLTVAGVDPVTGATVSASTPDATVEIQRPAALTAAASASRLRLTVAEEVDVSLAVTNTGDATAIVTPAADVVDGATATAIIVAAPAQRAVAGGATETFTWRLRTTSAGALATRLRVDGQDANTLATVTAGADVPAVQVDVPPALATLATSSAAQVNVAQAFTVSLDVANQGGADADVVPALAPSGTGLVAIERAPEPALVAGGGSVRFTWSVSAVSAGVVSFRLSATGVDRSSGAAVAEAASNVDVSVVRPAALSIAAGAPARVSTGQAIDVTVTVRNTGDAAAAISAALEPTGPVQVATAPAAAEPLEGGGVRTLGWTFATTGSGTAAFRIRVTGTDANDGRVFAVTADASTSVQRPAALSATASTSRSRLSVGEDLDVTLSVRNTGEAAATVSPSAQPSGTATVTLASAPSARTIAGGAEEAFTWRYHAAASGTLVVAARADGQDANSSASVTASATAPSVQVDASPVLSATASASAAEVDTAQPFTVTLRVANAGGADALVTPSLVASGTGTAAVERSPSAAVVAGGSSATFTWSLTALAAGTASFQLFAAGVDQNSGASVTGASASTDVRIVRPAALLVAASAPGQVSAGQPIDVTVTVQNTGDALVTAIAAAVDAGGPVQLSASPTLPASLAGGATATLRWTYATTAAGAATFHARVSATDANSGAALSATADAATTVQRPAALEGTASATPSPVNRGGTVTLTLVVKNGGDVDALAVVPDPPVVTGSATKLTGPVPASADVTAATPVTFIWTYQPTAAGSLAFTATARGRDRNSNAIVASPPAQTSTVAVQEPGALVASLAAPPAAAPGTRFNVSMKVSNTGGATVQNVAPELPMAGTGTALVVPPVPAPVTLAGGASTVFTWTLDATGEGRVDFSARAAGVDVNDSTARSAFALGTTLVGDVVEVAAGSNAFQDGSPFAYVTGYKGEVWLGPNRFGNQLARLYADGSGVQVLSFKIYRDQNSTGRDASRNQAYAADRTYASFGFTGCSPDQFFDACGPDNEDGRGLLTSAKVGTDEWLVAGSARSGGELSYVYLTKDAAPTLTFSYVDLDSVLGSSAHGIGAAAAFNGRLYFGFSDLPFGLVLHTPPTGTGIDVGGSSTSGPVTDLRFDEAFKVTGGSFTSIATVDAFAEFNGRLYAFDNTGCIVSTGTRSAAPLYSSDFANCTPSQSTSTTPIAPPRQYDLEPRDKPWPQVATRGSTALYAIRNATTGAQLWTCDPTLSGVATACETGDWTWMQFTAEGSDAPPRATLLVATPRWLYLGLEYPTGGVRLYRAPATIPFPRKSDFRGRGGVCTLDQSGCEGFLGNGLGVTATRILDADAITVGMPPNPTTTSLWFTVRSGTSAYRLFQAGG